MNCKLFKSIFFYTLFFGFALMSSDIKAQIKINYPEDKFEIIGELGKKMGSLATIEGEVVFNSVDGYQIVVHKIDDSLNQRAIVIPVDYYFFDFGDSRTIAEDKLLPKIKKGRTYRLRVYETASYIGKPLEAYREAKIFHKNLIKHVFTNRLIAMYGEEVKEVEWKPSDFLGRKMLIAGKAKNIKDTPFLMGSGWKIKLTNREKWKKEDLNYTFEAYGLILETNEKNTYKIDEKRLNLLKLKDQVGKKVLLRGTMPSNNGEWWFNYRGEDIFIEDVEQLPNWSYDNHYKEMTISGTLKLIKDSNKKIKDTEGRCYCKLKYKVVNAKIEPIDKLLIPELLKF